jgi:mono/diheme cytochrome c family protein
MSARPKGTGRQFILRHRILFAVLGAGTILVIGMIAGAAVLLSGALSTAATVQHARLTHRLLETGLRYSVDSYSESIVAPSLDDDGRIARGLACFRAHCVECHGAPGVAPDPEALGLMPIPGNLAEAGRNWRPAALYYVTRKGIRMTGMPAWEYRLAEDDLWSIVAFLKSLPSLGRDDYARASAGIASADCVGGSRLPVVAASGDVVLRQYACHSCHRIEGVVGPDTDVGPPLLDWSERRYIAGTLPNTRENLARWIVDPAGVDPATLMPDLGVPPAHARQMADYLLTPK